jgi:radical SAM protein with 4Fe4S-binding SPASM domain
MKEKVSEQHIEFRRKQELEHSFLVKNSDDLMASLIVVELNTTELCNRTCSFCPRVDPEIYPNQKLHMSLVTAEKIARDLSDFSYKGRVSFSGFGEPLLNKSILEIITIFRRFLPNNTLETNTNGDSLTPQKIKNLFSAGLSNLYINLYDGEFQREKFNVMMKEANIDSSLYRLRDHWIGEALNFGLDLNNRSGMVDLKVEGSLKPEELRGSQCYIPFFRMMIDWDGSVIFCSNDWGRVKLIGNVHKSHVKDIWLSKEIQTIRDRLAKGDRDFSPCKSCSVIGTLHGKTSFDLLNNANQK